MSDPTQSTPHSWSTSSTMKERNTIQRAVVALLDELAPERPPARRERAVGPIQEYRTPSGCVLQAPSAAVSLSWFPETAGDAELGELHVLVWRGVVSRRGGPPSPAGSRVVRELMLHPMERALDDAVWRAADGSTYDTAGLAARCLALLEEETRAVESEARPVVATGDDAA